jgi:hypothetical protein
VERLDQPDPSRLKDVVAEKARRPLGLLQEALGEALDERLIVGNELRQKSSFFGLGCRPPSEPYPAIRGA